jgi:hypothetical protein
MADFSPYESRCIGKVHRGEAELDEFPGLYEKLFDHFIDNNEMPYGTAKARDGDPVEWIGDHLGDL